MSTPTPPPGLPPKPPLTLSPQPAPAASVSAPAGPPELPTFGTTGIPAATALLWLGVPLLGAATVVLLSLASPTLGLILGGLVLLAALAAFGWQASRGRRGARRPGASRLGRSRLGRALAGSRLGRAVRSAGGRGLARARNGRFASRLGRFTGGRSGSRPGGRRSGASRGSRLLGRGRSLPTSRPGSRAGGSRSGGRAPGGRLGRFLPRGVSGARSAHGATGRPGRRPTGRTPGTGRGSRGATSRVGSLLTRLTRGSTPGKKGPSSRRPGKSGSPSGGSRGKGPGKTGRKPAGKSKGKDKGGGGWDSDGMGGAVGGVLLGGFLGFSRLVANGIRSVDGHAVADALRAPFKPAPARECPDYDIGIEDVELGKGMEVNPPPPWWPDDAHEWPPDHDDHPTAPDTPVKEVWPVYAWPDEDQPAPPSPASPHPSPHPPDMHEHHESPITTRRTGMAVTVTDYATHFENLTEESSPADRRNALNEAAADATARRTRQIQEAERLRADARAAVKFPDRMSQLNAKAAELESDAEKNRLLAAHFTTRSAEQTD